MVCVSTLAKDSRDYPLGVHDTSLITARIEHEHSALKKLSSAKGDIENRAILMWANLDTTKAL